MKSPDIIEIPGHTIGSYRITAKIGNGGMGAVYSAEHQLLGRKAAIKVLLPELCGNQDIVHRFFNEAKAATAIRHPGIVEVYDFGHASDGSAYIVMEYLEGHSLAERLRRVPRMSTATALFICSQISSALTAAHATGIVHRDLKPDNIFLIPDPDVPGGERAKLLDFGIAKLTDKLQRSSVRTRTGTLMGTPAYMSPEQCKGAERVREGSDLYAVGCILYEMLCGEPPFLAEGAGEVVAQHIYCEPRPLRKRVPALDPAIDALVLRLLSKKPSNRPRSASDLRKELDNHLQASGADPAGTPAGVASALVGSLGSSPDISQQTTRWGAIRIAPSSILRHRRLRWIPVLLGLPLALGGVSLALSRHVEPEEPGPASASATTTAPGPMTNRESRTPSSALTPLDDRKASIADLTAVQPEPPAPIRITIHSRPGAVAVYRMPGHFRAGITPYEFETDVTTVPLRFVLKKRGYRDLTIDVPTNETGTYSFDLARRSGGPSTTQTAEPTKAGLDVKQHESQPDASVPTGSFEENPNARVPGPEKLARPKTRLNPFEK